MMSLEEFYSAIADAYSVAKGERSHYTKEEVTEKLNRQLKSGRIVGEATTQAPSNGDMSWIRNPSNRGFGVGMSADEVLESVDNKPAEENLDWRKGIREYEAATKNIVKALGQIYESQQKIKQIQEEIQRVKKTFVGNSDEVQTLLEEYESIVAAAEAMGVKRGAIDSALYKRHKTSCGFIWNFLD